jgi:GNAT superfamily N-acetyltransferase
VAIRPARAADVLRIADLCRQLGYPSTPSQVKQRLRQIRGQPGHGVFVADLPGTGVIGWVHVHLCSLLEEERQAEIGGLVVDEEHRGSGAGRRLARRAEAWARGMKCRVLRLRTNVIRRRAQRFYNRNGYRHVKTQRVYRKNL